ncbi:MAG: crossover junction endodeoxyribonuclease RuvC [Chloroflexota bacterium]
MRALGVDPGTAITGWGVVDLDDNGQDLHLVAYGAITTPAKTPLPDRLTTIFDELTAIIAQHQPDTAALEVLFFSRNTTTALSVGHGRGAAMLAMAKAGLDIAEYKPLEIKQAVVGYGGADKGQVQRMVKLLLELEDIPKPDDAADGLAISICHLHSMRLKILMDQQA